MFPAATFTDADGDTLTYTATLDDNSALPSWLSFAPATRTFSGTPTAADVGTVSVKVTASDGDGGSVSDTFDIVVDLPTLVSNAGQGAPASFGVAQDRSQAFTTGAAGATLSSVEIISGDTAGDAAAVSLCTVDVNNHPVSTCTELTAPPSFAAGTLVFRAPANTTLAANTTYSLLVVSPGRQSLTLDVTTSDNEDAGGATDWSIANAFDYKTSTIWTDNSSSWALYITIKGTINNAPTVATAIPDQTATAGTAFSYTFRPTTFTDADGDTLTYTATKSDDTALPAWLSFTAAERAFSGTPQAADVETVSVKVTASDGNSGSVSDTFDIVVGLPADTTAPRVASIVRQTPTSSPTNADSLTWRVTFSEAVSNVDAADFVVSGTTATVTAVAAVSGVTGAYDVTASGGNLASVSATVTLTISSSHNIEDAASNDLSNTAPTGTNDNSYVLDNTAPSVTISGVPSASNAPFTATFTFSEAVTGFAVGDITLGQRHRLKLHGHEHDGLYGAGHTDGQRNGDGERAGQCGAGCRRQRQHGRDVGYHHLHSACHHDRGGHVARHRGYAGSLHAEPGGEHDGRADRECHGLRNGGRHGCGVQRGRPDRGLPGQLGHRDAERCDGV